MDPRRRFAAHLQFFILIVLAGPFFATGCSGSSYVDSDNSGRTLSYQPGLPNFNMEAIVTWRDRQPGIDLYLSIPSRSLSYVRSSRGFVAAVTTSAQVQTREGRQLVSEEEWVDSSRVDDYEATQKLDPITLRKRVRVSPGLYHVVVAISDRTTKKTTRRSQDVEVFSLDTGRPQLSRLWLETRTGSGEAKPVVMLHLPANFGSLISVSILYNAQDAHGVFAQYSVIKVMSDTTSAAPPYSYFPMQGSSASVGIDYAHRDTVHVELQEIRQPQREMPIEFQLPPLARGIYMMEEKVIVYTSTDVRSAVVLRQTYELAIRGINFPRPSTIDELADALPYLAKKEELDSIRSAPTVAEKRRQFELFWLKLGRNQQGAANLIKQYYTRVEEANLFFTTYKEGWKTDRGMIYIIMGPPVSVSHRLNDEYWSYNYSEQESQSTFTFQRSRYTDPPNVFPSYVLVRQQYYAALWDREVNRWRSGMIQ
jgi:GWxTD domain-containing protein